jgi:hypothetical protein
MPEKVGLELGVRDVLFPEGTYLAQGGSGGPLRGLRIARLGLGEHAVREDSSRGGR